MQKVSFVKANEITDDKIKEAIRNSLSLINYDFTKKVNTIAIKPNMCYYYHPSTGEVTDPAFIADLIDVMKENFSNADISIVESDASAMKCRYVFKMLGYDKLAKEKNVRLINLCEEKSKQQGVTINGRSFQFSIPELLLESDLLVNVPKIKYMNSVKITCALKNIYGCNAVQRKSSYHWALDEAIVGLNKLIRTRLVVVDGLVVNGKFTKKLGLVLASENVVAADAAASRLLGISPKSVKQLSLASRESLGELDFVPVGDFDYFKRNFPRKGMRENMFERGASAYLKMFHRS